MISSSFCSSIDIQTDFFLIQLPFVRYSYSLTLYFSSAYSTFLLRVITVHSFLWKKSEPILNLIISSKKAEHIYFLNKCCISFLKLEKKKNKEWTEIEAEIDRETHREKGLSVQESFYFYFHSIWYFFAPIWKPQETRKITISFSVRFQFFCLLLLLFILFGSTWYFSVYHWQLYTDMCVFTHIDQNLQYFLYGQRHKLK